MREADVAVDDDAYEAMGIEALVGRCEAAGLRELEELACHGTGALVRVTVESRIDESRLADLDPVDDWHYVDETDAGHVYRIAFTAPSLPEDVAASAADLVGTCDPDLSGEATTLSLVGPQASIAETIDGYAAAGVSPDLRRLTAYEGRSGPLDALTDRQREVLRTAFELGYYDVPRTAATTDVAAELDLDDSTVSEHLQRAERNLLARLFE
ncbi:helix-turn-helix domain-containing protein [Halovivax limisalsi]|uniref:helix-turn-helix domain-containing protein n=1 Tax=Halovivax limisalsi TaxID=1453760 RepID=UPI001FFD04E6|nr:helix-turn-helix domain-containing protein [Halovivax limisalsi]